MVNIAHDMVAATTKFFPVLCDSTSPFNKDKNTYEFQGARKINNFRIFHQCNMKLDCKTRV